MIARVWYGWTPPANADAYQEYVTSAVLDHLRQIDGFLGLRLWRREERGEVEFVVVTSFASLEAVRGFAGDDVEHAVVEPEARRLLSRFEERCRHYDVAATSGSA